MYWNYSQFVNILRPQAVSFVEGLSLFQSVYYQRVHCIGRKYLGTRSCVLRKEIVLVSERLLSESSLYREKISWDSQLCPS